MLETRRDSTLPLAEVLRFLLLQLALSLLLFSPALASGRVLLPAELLHALYPWGAYFTDHTNHNRDLSDVILQSYPWFVHWGERVRELSWPLWNPLSGLGLPFAANPLTCSYFPLTALSLLPKAIGWNALLLGRLVLAGTSAYVWLRSLGRSRGAAGIGGLAYSFSFPFFGVLAWPLGNVNALFPLLLLAARRLALDPGRRAAAAFALVLFLSHLGGQPEAVFLDVGAAIVVFLLPGRAVSLRARARATAGLVLAGLLGTFAAAIQLLPFLDYLSHSRVWLEAGHAPAPLPARFLVSWLAPLFFGSPVERRLLPNDMPFTDRAAYVGITMLALACAGLLMRPSLRRIAAPLALVVLSVGLAYGLPPLGWLLRLPLLDKTSVQRSLPIAAMGVIVLGSFGIDRLRALRRSHPGRFLVTWLVPGALGLVLFAVLARQRPTLPPSLVSELTAPHCLWAAAFALSAWMPLLLPARGLLRRQLTTWSLGALVLADLWRLALPFYGAVPPRMVFFPTKLTDFLRREAAGHRVLPLRYVMPPNLNTPYGIVSVLSYDALDTVEQARFLRRLHAFAGVGLYTSVVSPESLRNPEVARLAGVQALLDDPTAPRLDTPEFARETGFSLERIYDEPDGRVYRITEALSLVSCRPTAEPDPGLVRFDALLQAGDPRASRDLFLDAAAASEAGAGCSLTWSRPSPERIRARVDSRGSGWVVVTEALDGGWRGSVDGEPAAIVRANDVLRVIHVGSGRHDVEFAYRPASFRWGAGVSLGALVVLAVLAWPRRRSEPGRGRRFAIQQSR